MIYRGSGTVFTVVNSSNTSSTCGSTIDIMPGTATSTIPSTMVTTTPIVSDITGMSVVLRVPDDIEIEDGKARTIRMPDGALIRVEKDGSYWIDDADAQVVYRACRVRDFNAFLNASDKIESFIRYCGEVGVRQGDVLAIPIKHFIQWLVIEAAKADGEEPPLQLPDLSKPRCLQCGRFMSPAKKAQRIEFCRVQCFERRMRMTCPKLKGVAVTHDKVGQ